MARHRSRQRKRLRRKPGTSLTPDGRSVSGAARDVIAELDGVDARELAGGVSNVVLAVCGRGRAARRQAGTAAAARRGRVARQARARDHRGEGARVRGRLTPDARARAARPRSRPLRADDRRRARGLGDLEEPPPPPARPTRRSPSRLGEILAAWHRATLPGRDGRRALRRPRGVRAAAGRSLLPNDRRAAGRSWPAAIASLRRAYAGYPRLPRPRRLLAEERPRRRRRHLGDRLRGRPLRRPRVRRGVHAQPPAAEAAARPDRERRARTLRARASGEAYAGAVAARSSCPTLATCSDTWAA